MKTDKEICQELWNLCDGTTDEEVSIAVPMEYLKRLGSSSGYESDFFVEQGVACKWIQVSKVRELIYRKARHHMFDNYGGTT